MFVVYQDVLFSRSLEAEYHLRADKLNQPLDSCSQTDKTCSATTKYVLAWVGPGDKFIVPCQSKDCTGRPESAPAGM